MKMKLNLNVDAVKRTLLQHGEKAVFGLAVLLLLLFFWTTLQLEVLPAKQQPDELKKQADEARQHVLTSKWDESTRKAKNIEVVDYPARATHVPLEDRDYPLLANLDKPLWDAHGKRPAPKLFPVEELAAAAGNCFLAIKHEAAPAEGAAKKASETAPEGFYYVAVTGVVPLRKQTAEYEDAFRSAIGHDEATDRPVYEDMQVERAEVTGPDAKELDWKPVDLAAADAFVSSWASSKAGAGEVVDAAYVDEVLTFPLPSPLGKDWTPAVAGHAKIPPAERFDENKRAAKEPAAAVPETSRGRGNRSRNAAGGSKPATAPAPAPTEKAATSGPKVDRKLYRFVDYFAEPGRQYRYRVKLALSQSELQAAGGELKEPELAQAQMIETPWSEPSPPVTVPRGVLILAGPVAGKPTAQASHDPEAEILVVTFDRQRGGEPAVKKQVQRGVLANFHENSLRVPSPDHTGSNEWENVDIQSNSLVVDVQGGRRLSQKDKKLIEPVEVLVLDADGKLSVCDELDDAEEFHSRIDAIDKKEAPKPKAAAADDSNPYSKPKPTKARRPKKCAATP